GDITPAGLQIRDIGCFFENLGDIEQVEFDATFVRIAGRCSAALVDPPDAATTAAAFSSARRVTMSRGRIFDAISSITFSPAKVQKASRISYGAGAPAEYGSARPIASDTVAMVLAVNCAPQAPADGQATFSSSSRSASDMPPTEWRPTASNRSCTVTGLPRKLPGRIEPP